MAESPLVTLGRLLGGVVLMQGDLGHQVLGQLLVTGSSDVAIAGAALVIAGTTGRRNVVGQIALRTIAPTLAGRALLQRQEDRIDRKQTILDAKEKKLDERERKAEAREQAVCKQELDLKTQRATVDGHARDLQNELDRASAATRSHEPVTTGRDAPAAAPPPSETPPTVARPRARKPPVTKAPAARKPAAPPPRIGRKKR